MTARIPAAAAPKAVVTAALSVEAVVIVPTPRRSPSSITSAVARSLLDAVGPRVSSLIHSRGAPNRCRRAGAAAAACRRSAPGTAPDRRERAAAPDRFRVEGGYGPFE